MKKSTFAIVLLALGVAGCNIGNAPEPMSETEVRQAVNNAKPEDQISWISRSPMPQAEKDKKIAEIKAKYGLK